MADHGYLQLTGNRARRQVTVVVLHDGTERPASQRLRMTAFHWKGHLEELNA